MRKDKDGVIVMSKEQAIMITEAGWHDSPHRVDTQKEFQCR